MSSPISFFSDSFCVSSSALQVNCSLGTRSKLKLSNACLNKNYLLSFLSVPCFSFLLISYLVQLMLSCSRPNGYHLKCYQESKRVCQLMRLVPGCRLTRLNTSPANTNTSGFTLFLNSNDKKLRNKIR